MQQKIKLISQKLNIAEERVLGALRLLDDGATIPFIARYRKEATGGLDEVEIAAIGAESEKFDELVKRKEFVIEAIETAGALTDELKARIENSWDATEIEDIYLPYKQKKRTRATIAREAGLEPLAKIIMAGNCNDIEAMAMRYVNEKVAHEPTELSPFFPSNRRQSEIIIKPSSVLPVTPTSQYISQKSPHTLQQSGQPC